MDGRDTFFKAAWESFREEPSPSLTKEAIAPGEVWPTWPQTLPRDYESKPSATLPPQAGAQQPSQGPPPAGFSKRVAEAQAQYEKANPVSDDEEWVGKGPDPLDPRGSGATNPNLSWGDTALMALSDIAPVIRRNARLAGTAAGAGAGYLGGPLAPITMPLGAAFGDYLGQKVQNTEEGTPEKPINEKEVLGAGTLGLAGAFAAGGKLGPALTDYALETAKPAVKMLLAGTALKKLYDWNAPGVEDVRNLSRKLKEANPEIVQNTVEGTGESAAAAGRGLWNLGKKYYDKWFGGSQKAPATPAPSSTSAPSSAASQEPTPPTTRPLDILFNKPQP